MFQGGLGGSGGGDGGGGSGGSRPPSGGPGSDFDFQSILRIAASFVMASPMLLRLKKFHSEVQVVRRHLVEAAVEIGAADDEEAKRLGVLPLFGLVLGHWVEMVTGAPEARGEDDRDQG